MLHGTHGTCVQMCTAPPMSNLAQVNKATVALANCKWSTVPQIVYYRMRAWIVVSTLPRASNLSLEKYFLKDTCTSLCFRTTLITNAAPSWESEGFSKADSTKYCNSRDTQNQEGAQLLAAPPMHKIQQKWKQQELFKPCRQEQGMDLKT